MWEDVPAPSPCLELRVRAGLCRVEDLGSDVS